MFQWSGKLLLPKEHKNQTASAVPAKVAAATGICEGDGVSKTSNDETLASITVGTSSPEKADVAYGTRENSNT